MINITLAILGQRLRQLREHLELKQSDVAKNAGMNQNIVSRIENGKGGNIDQLLALVNYFNRFFYLDTFFSSHFEVVEINSISDEEKLNSIAIERIKLAQENLANELGNVIKMLGKG
ncbi:MAG: hypothetical protein CMO01_01810 [Thalassobius sp.]|nr:hypothetical protein [Thalassovita sp.]